METSLYVDDWVRCKKLVSNGKNSCNSFEVDWCWCIICATNQLFMSVNRLKVLFLSTRPDQEYVGNPNWYTNRSKVGESKRASQKDICMYLVERENMFFLFIQYHVAVFVFPFDWLGKVLQKYFEYWFLLDNRQYINKLEMAGKLYLLKWWRHNINTYAPSIWNHPWHQRWTGELLSDLNNLSCWSSKTYHEPIKMTWAKLFWRRLLILI